MSAHAGSACARSPRRAAERGPVVLGGSSLGAYISAQVSLQVPTRGLFLMVPPTRMGPLPALDAAAVPISVVHAWHDEVIPAGRSDRLGAGAFGALAVARRRASVIRACGSGGAGLRSPAALAASTLDGIALRPARAEDADAIEVLTLVSYFDVPGASHREHQAIEALRADGALSLSWVAEHDGYVVAHLAASPVALSDGGRDSACARAAGGRPRPSRPGPGRPPVACGAGAIAARRCRRLRRGRDAAHAVPRRRLRARTGLTLDGRPLLAHAFGDRLPPLAEVSCIRPWPAWAERSAGARVALAIAAAMAEHAPSCGPVHLRRLPSRPAGLAGAGPIDPAIT